MNSELLAKFKAAGISAYRLSKLSGVSQSSIGRWIKGESELVVSNFEKIAKALGVLVDMKGGE